MERDVVVGFWDGGRCGLRLSLRLIWRHTVVGDGMFGDGGGGLKMGGRYLHCTDKQVGPMLNVGSG